MRNLLFSDLCISMTSIHIPHCPKMMYRDLDLAFGNLGMVSTHFKPILTAVNKSDVHFLGDFRNRWLWSWDTHPNCDAVALVQLGTPTYQKAISRPCTLFIHIAHLLVTCRTFSLTPFPLGCWPIISALPTVFLWGLRLFPRNPINEQHDVYGEPGGTTICTVPG